MKGYAILSKADVAVALWRATLQKSRAEKIEEIRAAGRKAGLTDREMDEIIEFTRSGS